ncbi:MAG: hypothetical protein HWE25_14305 [Alphaproteobacteria bacterium]|nr:hypothetical protein [Alphaproteobacteria bacterium]
MENEGKGATKSRYRLVAPGELKEIASKIRSGQLKLDLGNISLLGPEFWDMLERLGFRKKPSD